MKMQLISKAKEAKDVTSFVFEPEQEIKWLPGQFLHYTLTHENPDNRGMERWFTISAAPFEGHIQLTTRQAAQGGSTFKKALFNQKIGSYLEADNPEGDFLIDQSANKHILIAGGIGITPYRSMIVQANFDNKMPDIHLLCTNQDQDIVFGEELSQIALKQQNLKIKRFIGSNSIKQSDLKQHVALGTAFYLSGPTSLVKDFKEILLGLGVVENSIKIDFFPGY